MIGWKQSNVNKIELASELFPLNRTIALGPAYYYLIKNEPSEQVLSYLDIGLKYDPNAVDLLQAKVKYSLILGKQKEATEAYIKLMTIAPTLVR